MELPHISMTSWNRGWPNRRRWACCHLKSTLNDTEQPQIATCFFIQPELGEIIFKKEIVVGR